MGVWNKGGFWGAKLKKARHFQELKYWINKYAIDIMIICEANVTHDEIRKLVIPGYEFKYGTVGTNRLVLVHRNHLIVNNIKHYNSVPTIALTVKHGGTEYRIIGTYREFKSIGGQTRTINEQLRIFREFMTEMREELKHKKIIWGGDFNVDWNMLNKSQYDRKKILETLYEHTVGLKQIVTENTRNVEKSSTMIDLIFTKGIQTDNLIVENGTGSDHCLLCVDIITNVKSPVESRKMRNWKNFNKDRLLKEAKKIDWISICWEENVDKQVEMITQKCQELYEKEAPIMNMKIKDKLEWRTEELDKIISTRNIMRRRCTKYQQSISAVINRDRIRQTRERLQLPVNLPMADDQARLEINSKNWADFKILDKHVRNKIKTAQEKREGRGGVGI